MDTFSPIQPISLRDQVVGQIRAAIIEGRLKPNDHITEASLTEQLGVSRTPVREALILLEREGLVVSIPNRGFYVRVFEARDVEQIFSMRTTLENFAAELIIDRLTGSEYAHLENLIDQQAAYLSRGEDKAARSTDMAFHRYLITFGGHSMLIQQWQAIVAQIAALLSMRAEAFADYDERLAVREHRAILEAYRTRELPTVMALNRQINNRVSTVCQQALALLFPG